MLEYRLTLELLIDREWPRGRLREEWREEGEVQAKFDHNEVIKSLRLAAADAEERLGHNSQEAIFLTKLTDLFT